MANEDPNELIRVEATDTKHQYTIARRSFDGAAHKVLAGEPAVDAGGSPLPPVFPETKTKTKPASGN